MVYADQSRSPVQRPCIERRTLRKGSEAGEKCKKLSEDFCLILKLHQVLKTKFRQYLLSRFPRNLTQR